MQSAVAHAHGTRELVWPQDPQFGRASAGKIAMWIFLVSDGLSFAGLLLAYGILRGESLVWRHPGEPALGVAFTAGLTFLLICSSGPMGFAFLAAERGGRGRGAGFLPPSPARGGLLL